MLAQVQSCAVIGIEGALQWDEVDVQLENGVDGGARVLPEGCIWREVAQGGDAAVAFADSGVSPGSQVSQNDYRSGGERDDSGQSCGGGSAVSAQDGDASCQAMYLSFSPSFVRFLGH